MSDLVCSKTPFHGWRMSVLQDFKLLISMLISTWYCVSPSCHTDTYTIHSGGLWPGVRVIVHIHDNRWRRQGSGCWGSWHCWQSRHSGTDGQCPASERSPKVIIFIILDILSMTSTLMTDTKSHWSSITTPQQRSEFPSKWLLLTLMDLEGSKTWITWTTTLHDCTSAQVVTTQWWILLMAL